MLMPWPLNMNAAGRSLGEGEGGVSVGVQLGGDGETLFSVNSSTESAGLLLVGGAIVVDVVRGAQREGGERCLSSLDEVLYPSYPSSLRRFGGT